MAVLSNQVINYSLLLTILSLILYPIPKKVLYLSRAARNFLEYSLHFKDALPQNCILAFLTHRDHLHILFHLGSKIWFVQFHSHVFIRLNKVDSNGCRNERLVLLLSVVTFLNSFDVFVDGCVSTDTLRIHFTDEVGFCEQGRWLRFAFSHVQLGVEFFSFVYRRKCHV